MEDIQYSNLPLWLYVSKKIEDDINNQKYKKGDFCFVSEMAKKGDVKAIEIIDKYCQIVALKAYYATLMYDIKTIYFGGAISQNKDLFDKINYEYEKLSTLHSGKKQATLEISAFKEEANLLGAYFLIKDMQI